jgi:ABC-type branched-subunit amino acid transport system ATPase component/ABC-type branched-subunit amino acid transport system permease subunit
MTLAFQISAPVAVLGLIVGTTYGLLAIGLVLVYRSSRVINFAHGSIGAFSAAVFGVVVVKSHVPYYLALPLVAIVGAAMGIITEVAVMRRLKDAPPIVKLVATIGFASFLQVFSLVVNSTVRFALRYPEPPFFPQFRLGALAVGRAHSAMLFITPIVVVLLAWFVNRSRTGVAIRGAAANPEAARLSGVSASRMSALSWALAGALSAYTAVLLYPTLGFGASASFGPGLLVRALVAAVVARMSNLPIAFGAGLAVGVVEQELRYNTQNSGPVNMVLLALILIALVTQTRRGSAREEDAGDWLSVQPWRALPRDLAGLWRVRALGWGTAIVATVVAVVLGITVNNSSAVILVAVMAFAVIGLGIGLISGLAGQLSLGQFALAGVGSAASFLIVDNTGNFVLGFLLAGFAGAAASVLLGIPAVRIRGLMFAVATLAFAQAAPWLFEQSWLFGIGKDPHRPIIGSFAIDTSRRYYFFTLVVSWLMFLLARNVWQGGLGRRYRAVRDNEDNARAFTVSSTRAKLEAFAIAGFITGIGGALYAHSLSAVSGQSFPLDVSLTAVAIVAVGGIGMMAGPIIGALYLIALPRFFPLDSAGLAATQLGWLLLVLQFPGGVAQSFAPIRDKVIAARTRTERKAAIDLTDGGGDDSVGSTRLAPAPKSVKTAASDDAPILVVKDVVKAYGGLQAVSHVGFDVKQGETLGLIGPNGAGKTTLFEVIGGFVRPDEGTVLFEGNDVTRMSPEQRGRVGLIRSFQDAALFPTLSVPEAVQLSLERRMPTNLFVELAGLGFQEKRRKERADEIIDLMGLGIHRDKLIGELSTGTRRVTEIACLLALEPTLLLLDEPTSGIAQRESEAMGELLARVKQHLGTTMLIIEHDIPLIMSISDRIVAMAAGAVVTIGAPAQVRAHPAVVESYLGSSVEAIERSGNGAKPTKRRKPAGAQQCTALTRSGTPCSRVAVADDLCAQHQRLATVGR